MEGTTTWFSFICDLARKPGQGLAQFRLGPSQTLARHFSARLGMPRLADELRQRAQPELRKNSVRFTSQPHLVTDMWVL